MGKADLMSAIVNRRMSVHIMPRMSLRFPSIMSMGSLVSNGIEGKELSCCQERM